MASRIEVCYSHHCGKWRPRLSASVRHARQSSGRSQLSFSRSAFEHHRGRMLHRKWGIGKTVMSVSRRSASMRSARVSSVWMVTMVGIRAERALDLLPMHRRADAHAGLSRPPDRMSTAARSSTSRSGFSQPSGMTTVPNSIRLVRYEAAASTATGDQTAYCRCRCRTHAGKPRVRRSSRTRSRPQGVLLVIEFAFEDSQARIG